MRSSGPTPNPPTDRAVPLLLRVANEDHPRRCTGRKLLQRGLVRSFGPDRERRRGAPVLLDPHAERPLSQEDLPRARRYGVLGVDCSWNALGRRGGYPDGSRAGAAAGRRLPYLFASNPQHYGRLSELNTAEAFAAALWVLGDEPGATTLLQGFAGGTEFFRLNAAALERYRACATAEEIRAAERALY